MRDGQTARWVLAFDASCGKCTTMSKAVSEACGGKLEILPLTHPQVRQWREQSQGATAPWAPTLLRAGEESVGAWTGLAMAWPLVRRLGPRSTSRVLRALGRLRLNPQPQQSAPAGAGVDRKRLLQLGAGLIVAAGVTFAGRTPAIAGEQRAGSRLVEDYDCTGKPDGNYIHPYDCTKFMGCVAGQYAYERNCADFHPNPDNCPTGRLHYDAASDACLWSYEAGCVTEQAPR
ncbi:chitin binding peritrophin-A domain-containing protein [Streptomyces sp. NPDC058664]|uniref:chitin binding peritrophin-A domain-containing protein n=1 Tax=unclassified Streptomyces TaxID=2593676 RepID=UPI003663EE78